MPRAVLTFPKECELFGATENAGVEISARNSVKRAGGGKCRSGKEWK